MNLQPVLGQLPLVMERPVCGALSMGNFSAGVSTARCTLLAGHTGKHTAPNGRQW